MKNYLQEAINKQISVGGKFWCWHDWIYRCAHYPIGAWEYAKGYDALFLCVKCGKEKIGFFGAELTRYDENHHLINP